MEDEKNLASEATDAEQKEQVKTPFQMQKESWYDKVPLNVKQLDTIIYVGLALLVLTFIVIFLDAADIINPFGY